MSFLSAKSGLTLFSVKTMDVSSEALTKEKVKTLLPFLIFPQVEDPIIMRGQPWRHGKVGVGVAVDVTVIVSIKV